MAARMQKRRQDREQDVPKTFYDMFCFNAAVMDLLEPWMYEILECFDIIVLNAGNSFRLQEECDVLTLKIAKTQPIEQINLSDFKAVMLASLRSLVPKGWSSSHESAWSWLWEQVERLLQMQIGRVQKREKLLSHFFENLSDELREKVIWSIYERFFSIVPAGRVHPSQATAFKIFQVFSCYLSPCPTLHDFKS